LVIQFLMCCDYQITAKVELLVPFWFKITQKQGV